jgi:hypothetical protein
VNDLLPCLVDWAWWLPFGVVAAIALRQAARLRLRGVGPAVPGLASLRALLDDEGCYQGVPVKEEVADRFGGGRLVLRDDAAPEIRLAAGMLDRNDVEALVVLSHERAHLARDLPFPASYRRLVLATAVLGLGLAFGQPRWAEVGTLLAWVAYSFACAHVLRDELAASGAVLGDLLDRDLPLGTWVPAAVRLTAAFAVYAAEWALIGAALYALTALARCR